MKPLRMLAAYAGSWWKSFRAARLRPHLSTLVFLIPVLAVLLLANVPGWRVVYLDPMGDDRFTPTIRANYNHGWPLTYLQRKTREPKNVDVLFSPWDLPHGIINYRGLALAGNVAAGLGILVLAGVLMEARRRRRRSWFQYHLWELLALVTLTAIGLSFYAVRRKEYTEQRKLYAWLHRKDSTSESGPQHGADWTSNGRDWQFEGPGWLLPFLGEDRCNELFARVYAIHAGGDGLKEVVKLPNLLLLRLGPSSKAETACLTQVPALEAIELQCTDDLEQHVELPPLPRLRALSSEIYSAIESHNTVWRIKGLAGLKSLESLFVNDDEFGDAVMAELDGLTRLRSVDLNATKITTAGLRHLRKATGLECLAVAYTQIDDAALPIIAQMKELSFLSLSGTHVTETGLESLKSLRNLRELYLDDTSLSVEGARNLQQALPNCKIE